MSILQGKLFSLGLAFGGFFSLPLAHAEWRSELRLFSDSFISENFEATEKKNYQFVGAKLVTEARADDMVRMDISGAVALGEPLLNYLNISEFYIDLARTSPTDEQGFSVGRKKVDWNELDRRWQLGLWEPVFKWNPLSPERQGLTGLFWDLKKSNYQFSLFASPIFIPNQGPSFDIQNGQFVRGNPWFNRPPNSLRFSGITTPIEYQYRKPDELEVVRHASYGARLNAGDARGLFFQASHIYKPSNDLAIGYNGSLDIPANHGVVELQPQVFYHSLSGGDLSYAFMQAKMGVSVLYDHPHQDTIFTSEWTHPVYADAFLSTVYGEYHTRFFDFLIQRLDVAGGKVTEEGPLSDPHRRPLMIRYPFRQANEVGLSGHVSFSRVRRLTASLRYLRSDSNDFALVKFNTLLKLSNLWNIYSEMQLIQARPLTVDNQNEIAQFANNDRFLVGVGYVF